jgi:hypothetical protein
MTLVGGERGVPMDVMERNMRPNAKGLVKCMLVL